MIYSRFLLKSLMWVALSYLATVPYVGLASSRMSHQFVISGLKCGACAFRIKKSLQEKFSTLDPKDIRIDFTGSPVATLTIATKAHAIDPLQIAEFLGKSTGFSVEIKKSTPLSD